MMLDKHLDSPMDYLSRRIKLETNCFCITVHSAAMAVGNMKAKATHLQKYCKPGWAEGSLVKTLAIQTREIEFGCPEPL